MRVRDIPLVPAVIGLILGPLSEQQFRRAVAISEGDFSVFLTRPISAALFPGAGPRRGCRSNVDAAAKLR